MKLCIDTNAYTALRRNEKKVLRLLEGADRVFIPTVVIGELYAGFYRGSRTERNIAELNAFLKTPGIIEVAISHDIASRYGLIIRDLYAKGTPIPTNDIWIAATAFETASQVLSDDQHFKKVPGLAFLRP